jgi:hypothetical protein
MAADVHRTVLAVWRIEQPRPGDVLVNPERLHARLALHLRKKVFQERCDRAFLSGVDLPECGDDQLLVRIAVGRMLYQL